MKNILISNLHIKDINHFTSDVGLYLRRIGDKPFKKMCNFFTNANIIRPKNFNYLSDEEYFKQLSMDYISPEIYGVKDNKNNIIVERYPELNKNEPYIFVCNHTCPEDIETILNIIDRNAYLVLGSIESLQYNPEMYLSWLNGMIPFDILNKKQRKEVFEKMLRVLKTNSILIFPEGSHNYSPNNLVNNLFDGATNLALQTKRKIVILTLIKDQENNISYVDASNPVDVEKIVENMDFYFENYTSDEKLLVREITQQLRDKMATAVYHIIVRHFKPLKRDHYRCIEEELRQKKIRDAFKKLKWDRDVFDAEYLVKKDHGEREHEEIITTLNNLTLNPNVLIGYDNRYWVLQKINMENKDVAMQMRNYWLNSQITKEKSKILKKQK